MKKYLLFSSLLSSLLLSLSLFGCAKEDVAKERCGDGICDTIESSRNLCPEDCLEETVSGTSVSAYDPETYTYAPVEKETGWTTAVSFSERKEVTTTIDSVLLYQTDYLVKNPTTDAQLDVTVFALADASVSNTYPAVILVPGGTGSKEDFLKPISLGGDSIAETFAASGFVVLIFSADGREDSTGEEDYNGYNQQDGLYELYRFLKDIEGVDETNIGLVSYSYGATMASGMLGRYQPDIKWYIEWEGPVNRWYTTFGCRSTAFFGSPGSFSCNDEDHWLEREAMRFVPYFPVDYFVIVQRAKDHAQSTVQHSVDMNNYAIQYLDWVRVNGPEQGINQEYTLETLPVLEGREYQEKILEYMEELAAK